MKKDNIILVNQTFYSLFIVLFCDEKMSWAFRNPVPRRQTNEGGDTCQGEQKVPVIFVA